MSGFPALMGYAVLPQIQQFWRARNRAVIHYFIYLRYSDGVTPAILLKNLLKEN